MRTTLLLINGFVLTIGHCGGPLMMRLYVIHGGKRVWFSSWIEIGGWPIIFIPILCAYFHRSKTQPSSQNKLFLMQPHLFITAAIIGTLTGLDDYIYAYGVARLPVSTVALIIASQLVFTAVFAFLLVKQKFTSYSFNAVFLLTIGTGVLAMNTSGDRPENKTKREYVLGFVMTVGSAGLYGFILPLVEFMYKKAKQEMSYNMPTDLNQCITVYLFLGEKFNGRNEL